MPVPEKGLDQWATWMEVETSYALSKFNVSWQQAYFNAGVTRGIDDFSIEMSAVGYFRRALQKRNDLQTHPTIALRAVQELGKSAHNHLVCAVNAQVSLGGAPRFTGALYDVLDEWREDLSGPNVAVAPLTSETEDALRLGFSELQKIQSEEMPDANRFQAILKAAALPLRLAFIETAHIHGWPLPGVSSEHDLSVWDWDAAMS